MRRRVHTCICHERENCQQCRDERCCEEVEQVRERLVESIQQGNDRGSFVSRLQTMTQIEAMATTSARKSISRTAAVATTTSPQTRPTIRETLVSGGRPALNPPSVEHVLVAEARELTRGNRELDALFGF